jgi:hypothetical protein
LTKTVLPLRKRILITAIIFAMIMAVLTKTYADEVQTASEKRIPSAKLTPSDNVLNLNEKYCGIHIFHGSTYARYPSVYSNIP